jgi:hypothetical protein
MIRLASHLNNGAGHFVNAVLKKTSLNYLPDDSIANMCLPGSLSAAARIANTLSFMPERLDW